jgi:uncharacterized membrane protein YcaP (DUF421 family)
MFMTEDELRARLRLHAVENERDVAHAYIEHDGRVSVIRMDAPGPRARAGDAGICR